MGIYPRKSNEWNGIQIYNYIKNLNMNVFIHENNSDSYTLWVDHNKRVLYKKN